MLYDTHMHTRFSGDSDADPEAMIEKAMEKGLGGICFTDHLDLGYREEPHLFDLDLEGYFTEMPLIREKYTTDAFEVCVGVELGLQPHLAKDHYGLTAQYPFDLVIGSVHVVDGADPYYESFYDQMDVQEAYRRYFDSVAENIECFNDFDTLGHLDYVVRYGHKYFGSPEADFRLSDHRGVIEEILQRIIGTHKSLEVNTGSFRYGFDEPNPCYDILRLYYELGGRDLTLGADAHSPEDVARGFSEAVPVLKQIGFNYFNVYKARIPQKFAL